MGASISARTRALWMRVRGLVKRADVEAELTSHVQMHVDDGVRAGMTEGDARRAALVKLGGVEQTRQAYRERSSLPVLENLLRDLHYALRQLVKAPAFAIAVVLTLALGIGANTAIFSVVDAVLKHPAGIDSPRQVVVMKTRYKKYGLDMANVSAPIYAAAATLNNVEAGAIEQATSFNIAHDGKMEHLAAARVSSKWFEVYGARPILGRTFAQEEDQPNAGKVVVLGYGTWQSLFGGQRDAIGKTLLLDGASYRVIGVMRSDFAWPRGMQMWVPLGLGPAAFVPDEGFNEYYTAVLRLRPGTAVAQFNAEFSTKIWSMLRQLGGEPYAVKSGWSVVGVPVVDYAAGSFKRSLFIVFAVVTLVLLIAAANVAGLILARASTRNKEFAVRAALGASAARMMQQVLVETMMLALLAAILGAAAGPWLGHLLLLMVPHDLANGFAVHMNWPVLGFTAATGMLTAAVAGLGPALRIWRRRRELQLQGETRSATASIEKQRLRSVFVVAEVSLAYLLLVGTGLFLTSLNRLQRVDPGFSPQGLVAGKVEYAGEDFKKNQTRQAAFVRGALEQLETQPGIRAAAAVEPLPFDPGTLSSNSFDIEGLAKSSNEPGPHSHLTYATPDYLKVMQIPLLRGRWFTGGDRKETPRVVVIDQRLAQKYWPNGDALGQHLDSDEAHSWATVVGVVRNIRADSLEDDTSDGMRYYPFAQVSDVLANFVVRTDGDAGDAGRAIERAVHAVDSAQAVTGTVQVGKLVTDSLAGRQLITWMFAGFAGVALLLSAIGVYALISYVTAQRTSEIGIRMALGAQRNGILGMVVGKALVWVAMGVVVGVGLSSVGFIVLNHYFSAFGGGMALSLLAAAGVLMLAGGFAGVFPAQRAASINPMRALRTD